jgi:hypothetical protein
VQPILLIFYDLRNRFKSNHGLLKKRGLFLKAGLQVADFFNSIATHFK